MCSAPSGSGLPFGRSVFSSRSAVHCPWKELRCDKQVAPSSTTCVGQGIQCDPLLRSNVLFATSADFGALCLVALFGKRLLICALLGKLCPALPLHGWGMTDGGYPWWSMEQGSCRKASGTPISGRCGGGRH